MKDGGDKRTLHGSLDEGETVGLVVGVDPEAGMTMNDTTNGSLTNLAVDDYDERPVETARELEELVRLRAELSWSAWKSHPRFKKDKLIREAQRRYGVVPHAAMWAALGVGIGPTVPANDVEPIDADAELANDPEFSAVCDASRDAWIEAHEQSDNDNGDNDAADPLRRAGGLSDE